MSPIAVNEGTGGALRVRLRSDDGGSQVDVTVRPSSPAFDYVAGLIRDRLGTG